MREIFFKAKRKDDGKWVEGYYYKMWENHYVLWGMNNDKPDMIEIDPETLCQYTGKKDKKGKKIWEHDIVSTIVFGPSTLVHRPAAIAYDERKTQYIAGFAYEDYVPLLAYYDDEIEVIGNVFDNPELLEE